MPTQAAALPSHAPLQAQTLALAHGLLRDPLPSFPAGAGGLQARPGDPGPRQLGQVSRELAGRRVQTPDEAGSGGCWGNLASVPGRELGFGGKRKGAACRIQPAPPGARGAPPSCSSGAPRLAPGSRCFSYSVDGCCWARGSSWVATPIPIPSFGFLGYPLCPGDGVFLCFLESSGSRDQSGVRLPGLRGASLHTRCPFPFPYFWPT